MILEALPPLTGLCLKKKPLRLWLILLLGHIYSILFPSTKYSIMKPTSLEIISSTDFGFSLPMSHYNQTLTLNTSLCM